MKSERHQNYFWIQWDDGYLTKLLACLPSIVLDRYLVNTSFDSGSLCPSKAERQQGWRSVGSLSYSPRIKDINWIPHDQFDEWLVFSQLTVVQSWEPVINYGGFSLFHPAYGSIQKKLWSQIDVVQPESFIAEGDHLIFITRSQHLHELASTLKDLHATVADTSS